MGNHSIPIGQTIGADTVRDTRSHDLLRPPPTHTQKKLQRCPVDKRTRKRVELTDNVVDSAKPGRFRGHGCFTMLVRTCAKCNII
jgi:hypothetical protein